MCVGVSVWLGWSGIRVAGFSLQHGYHYLVVVVGLVLSNDPEGRAKVASCVTGRTSHAGHIKGDNAHKKLNPGLPVWSLNREANNQEE